MHNRPALVRPLWLVMLACVAAACLAQAPLSAQAPLPPTKWCVLAYIDGDNNLGTPPTDYATRDIWEMESAMRPFDDDGDPTTDPVTDTTVRVLVQFDRPLPNTCHRFELLWVDPTSHPIDTIVADDVNAGAIDMGPDPVDSADPDQLAAFIRWGTSVVQAEHYLLVVWDHGEGWRVPYAAPWKALLADDTSGNIMSQTEFQEALGTAAEWTGRKLDLIYMDACLMGMAEVAYGIRDYCDVLVASEELVPGVGGPYDLIISRLYDLAYGDGTSLDVGDMIVDEYISSMLWGTQLELDNVTRVQGAATMSSIDETKMGWVASALTAFSNALINAFNADPNGLMPINIHTWWQLSHLASPLGPDLEPEKIDLGSFAAHAYYSSPVQSVRGPAWDLLVAVEGDPTNPLAPREEQGAAYWNYAVWLPGYLHHGLSIYYPCNRAPEGEYFYTALAQDTTWDTFIRIAPLGVQIGFAPDAYESDGAPENATFLGYWFTSDDFRGKHWFYFEDDTDCFTWYATQEEVDYIAVVNQGPVFDGRMYLLDQNGVVILTCDDRELVWRCPRTGTYYLAVVQKDSGMFPWAYGGSTYYDIVAWIETFTDVDVHYWAAKEIAACQHNDVVQGINGAYLPHVPVTRDQMAAFIARSLARGDANVPEGPPTPSFGDVPTDNWAYKYIEYCRAAGIVSGYEDGAYRPNAVVDRGQMAAFIARALAGGEAGVPAYAGYPHFRDVGAGDWALKYVEYLRNAKIVKGYTNWTYAPTTPVTRDQMAVFIYRAFLAPRWPPADSGA